jgi:hypothetical protein
MYRKYSTEDIQYRGSCAENTLRNWIGIVVTTHRTALNKNYTDKKENKNFLIYKEIHNGAVAKSYMTNGLP